MTQRNEMTQVAAFHAYLMKLAGKWLEAPVERLSPADVLTELEKREADNYRVVYLKYLLPLTDARFEALLPLEWVEQGHKTVWSMRKNDIYNDFDVNALCDALLVNMQETDADMLGKPLPEEYKDVQKLIWTFVNQSRAHAMDAADAAEETHAAKDGDEKGGHDD